MASSPTQEGRWLWGRWPDRTLTKAPIPMECALCLYPSGGSRLLSQVRYQWLIVKHWSSSGLVLQPTAGSVCFSGKAQERSDLPIYAGLRPFKANLRENKWEEHFFYIGIMHLMWIWLRWLRCIVCCRVIWQCPVWMMSRHLGSNWENLDTGWRVLTCLDYI